jgi:hypothetical protein
MVFAVGISSASPQAQTKNSAMTGTMAIRRRIKSRLKIPACSVKQCPDKIRP